MSNQIMFSTCQRNTHKVCHLGYISFTDIRNVIFIGLSIIIHIEYSIHGGHSRNILTLHRPFEQDLGYKLDDVLSSKTEMSNNSIKTKAPFWKISWELKSKSPFFFCFSRNSIILLLFKIFSFLQLFLKIWKVLILGLNFKCPGPVQRG